MINKAKLSFWLNFISWIVIVICVPITVVTAVGAVRRQVDVRKGTAEILAAIQRVQAVPSVADPVAMLVACANGGAIGVTCSFENSEHDLAIQAHYDRPAFWFYIVPVQESIHLVGVIYFDREVKAANIQV